MQNPFSTQGEQVVRQRRSLESPLCVECLRSGNAKVEASAAFTSARRSQPTWVERRFAAFQQRPSVQSVYTALLYDACLAHIFISPHWTERALHDANLRVRRNAKTANVEHIPL